MRCSTSRASRGSDLTAPLRRALAATLLGVAATAAWAQAPQWSLEAQRRLSGGSADSIALELARRTALIEEGEARLAAGDTDAAQQAFDNAALIVHAADIELGLVRTYMQVGEYRRALTFGSHAAGAHREFPGGMALYAWLLHVGGQERAAARMLDEAIARAPADPALLQAKLALSSPEPRIEGVLMAPPLRLAPYAASAAVSAGAHVVSNAVLMGDGRHVLAPASAALDGRRLWVRNGLGRTSSATLLQRLDDGLALLQLDEPLDPPLAVTLVPTAPFAGSPSYALAFTATDHARPAWPMLRQGFFARTIEVEVLPPLGIDLPHGPRGGPVFDRTGRLAGVAVSAADGGDRLVPASKFAHLYAGTSSTPPRTAGAAPISVDALYESALRSALQLIGEH